MQNTLRISVVAKKMNSFPKQDFCSIFQWGQKSTKAEIKQCLL